MMDALRSMTRAGVLVDDSEDLLFMLLRLLLAGAQPVLHPSAAEQVLHPSGSEFQDQVISLSPRNAVFETPEALDGNSTADVLRVYHNIVDDGDALKTNIIPFD